MRHDMGTETRSEPLTAEARIERVAEALRRADYMNWTAREVAEKVDGTVAAIAREAASAVARLGLTDDHQLCEEQLRAARSSTPLDDGRLREALEPFREQAETWLRISTDTAYDTHPLRDDTPLKDGLTVGDWVRLARALAVPAPLDDGGLDAAWRADMAKFLDDLYAPAHRDGCLWLADRRMPCQCGSVDRRNDLRVRGRALAETLRNRE